MQAEKRNLTQAKSHLNLNQLELYSAKDRLKDEEIEIEKCYSTTDDNYSFEAQVIEKDFNEEILIELAKRQKMLKDYHGGSSRMVIFNWVENVIGCFGLNSINQLSVYYRFATIYDIVMAKMANVTNNSIDDTNITNKDIEVKVIITTIFLIAYKFEGHSVIPISIPLLINSFLSDLNHIPYQDLMKQIKQTEVNLLSLLDYDFYSFNTNIHTMTTLILDLIKSNFCLSEEIIQLIEDTLPKVNKYILLSEQIIFNHLPIDIAALAFCATFNCISKSLSNEISTRMSNATATANANDNDNEAFDPFWIQIHIKDLSKLSNDLYNYLKNDLKVLSLTIHCIKAYPLFFNNDS